MNARQPDISVPVTWILTPAIADAARDSAFAQRRPYLDILEEMSCVAPELFIAEVGRAFDYPVLDMAALHRSTPMFDTVSFADCMERKCLLLRIDDAQRMLVIVDPFELDAVRWAMEKVKVPFVVAIAHRSDVSAYLTLQESLLSAMQGVEATEDTEQADDSLVDDISLIRISADTSPVVKLVNSTIYDALKVQASDIHLECDAGSLAIKYRVDGVLLQAGNVQGMQMAEQIVSRIKVMADLDIGERRVPQDGRFKVRIGGREIDFRVSVMPNIFGEDVVLRLLDRRALTEAAQSLRLESLGLDSANIEKIRRLARKPHGMLLVTGPTGSGKTTTLYAAITEINTGQDKIVTIEDPVEYRLPKVLQIPVNEKKGLTFARGLRSILRHDPDKIMIGEIRDDETAQIAVQASLTGHLVFTTVHANSVFDVLGRFLHMGVEPYSFAAALNGIVAQRLLRVNCVQCSVAVQPGADAIKDSGLDLAHVAGWTFMAGGGCGHCRGTGYKGRMAVAEVLFVNDSIRELISARAPLGQMKAAAAAADFISLREAALELVRTGKSTLAELNRVTA
jgi:general secretion pathway protein E